MVGVKAVLAASVSVTAIMASDPASAQSRRFNVEAQAAQSGVPELGRQAELQILAARADLVGRRVSAVTGAYDAREGVRLALRGSGLVITSDTGRTLTLGVSAAQARAGRGQITGAVIDPATGEYMRNASVQVVDAEGVKRTVTSGEGGAFRLTDLAAGTAQITVSFSGYPDQVSEVVVSGGQAARLNVAMARMSDAVRVSDVVVVGVREGDARAIMSQRQSMDIKNSLSAESYGDISEGNPGEFIKFMPGVDTDSIGDGTVRTVSLRGMPSAYTGVTLNGVNLASADANDGAGASRSFSFEQMSLSGLDSIEISKTVSADVDANAPAGTINVRTKRAFDRRGRRIMAQVSATTHSNQWDDSRRTGPAEGGYGDQRFLPNAQVEYSDVFFGRRLGVVASASVSNMYAEQEQITLSRNYVKTAANPAPLAINSIETAMGTREISRASASLNVDFRATDNLTLSMVAMLNRGTIWAGSTSPLFTTGSRTRGVQGDSVFDFTTRQPAGATTMTAENTVTFKKGQGRNLVPGFEYQRGGLRVDGHLAYSSSTSTYDPLGEKGAVYTMTTLPVSTGDFSATRAPGDYLGQAWRIQQVSGPDWSQASSFSIAGTPTIRLRNASSAEVKMTGGALNLTYATDIGAVPVVFKTGIKSQTGEYDYDNQSDNYLYKYVGALSNGQLLQAIQSTNQGSYADSGISITTLNGYSEFYLPSMYKLGQMYLNNPGDWAQVLSPTNWYNANVANRRHFEEATDAAYAMATAELTPRLKLRAGLRWERTETSAREADARSPEEVAAAGYAVSATTGRATTIEGLKYQYLSLPMADRRGEYDHFFPSASAKFAVTDNTDLQVGYSRTIRRPEVSQLAGVWSVDDVNRIVRTPNPGLEPELSDNYSVRVSHYFEPVGMIAVGYYRNKIKGLFQTVELTAEEFGYTGDDYADYIFETTRTVDGEAINIQGYEFEFSHEMSYLPGVLDGLSVRGSFMKNDPDIPIVRVADKLATLSLSYRKGPVKLFMNNVWTDQKYRSTTPSWFDAYWDTNLSGSYRLEGGWEAFFSVRNLFDNARNVIVPGELAPAGDLEDHSAIYIHGGRNITTGIRVRF